MAASSSSKDDAARAFSAAEVASAATAAAIGSSGAASASSLAAKLCDVAADAGKENGGNSTGGGGGGGHESSSTIVVSSVEMISACHRLNERFAACSSHDEAVGLAASLCKEQPSLGKALVALVENGDSLVELAVQLMQSLCLDSGGAQMLERAGVMPVVVASLRADAPLFRAHGLALLSALAERPELAAPLVRAGVVRLLCFLTRADDAITWWPYLLEIADSLLAVPKAVPEKQRQLLRDAFASAAIAQKAGELRLELPDSRRLMRLLIMLRALSLAGASSATVARSGMPRLPS